MLTTAAQVIDRVVVLEIGADERDFRAPPHQLYIPGLADLGLVPAVSIEDVRHLDLRENTQGFLYL